MSKERQELSGLEREVVTTLIKTKAVDFEALGAALAKFGPQVALTQYGDDWFCGTMRWFVRFYRLPDPRPFARMQDLAELRETVAPELNR